MSRRRGRGRAKDVSDGRTRAEKEEDDTYFIDERRQQGDPCSSILLSSLLHSYKRLFLRGTQIVVREADGDTGFYIHMDHFPDEEDFGEKREEEMKKNGDGNSSTAAAAATEDDKKEQNKEENKKAPKPQIPLIGFVKVRTAIRPRSSILTTEINGLKEKIDELDTEFQTIKVDLEFEGDNMDDAEKAAKGFQMRDLQRQLSAERAQLESLKEELERITEKGVEVWYSTADTEGRELVPEDVLDGFLPPDDDEFEEEARLIEELKEQEEAHVQAALMGAQIAQAEKPLREIAALRVAKGIRRIKRDVRKEAANLEEF